MLLLGCRSSVGFRSCLVLSLPWRLCSICISTRDRTTRQDLDLQLSSGIEAVAEIVAEIAAVDAVEITDLDQDEYDSDPLEIEPLSMIRILRILL